jgi:hypothetical protein
MRNTVWELKLDFCSLVSEDMFKIYHIDYLISAFDSKFEKKKNFKEK